MKLKDSRILACVVAALALLYLALAPRPADERPARAPSQGDARRAIVISLDGLDVRYLRRADELGLKIPTLRRLMREGVTAGVESVYPTVTYPNHTSIVTGAVPGRHRIVNNSAFTPPGAPACHYWYARDIKADALWEAAGRAGLKTGLVSWPVTVGAGDWNLPEIWKGGTSPDDFPKTIAEISRHARPAGLVEEIHRRHPDIYENVTRDEGDDMRARWAEYLLREKRPHLLLVHLFDLDHAEHVHGPFTPEALRILEKVDGYVGRVVAAAEEAGTLADTAVFIVSDHGFRPLSKSISPNVILARAGLIDVREESDGEGGTRAVVTGWRAAAYPSGGSCAIMLRHPHDREARARARAAFEEYAADGTLTLAGGRGVLRVVPAAEVLRLGAFPDAAFVLEAAPGYSFGDALAGDPLGDSTNRGTHGYLPSPADYRATFVASGLDVIRRGDLGDIHMTEVGPTIADVLGVALRDAQAPALRLK